MFSAVTDTGKKVVIFSIPVVASNKSTQVFLLILLPLAALRAGKTYWCRQVNVDCGLPGSAKTEQESLHQKPNGFPGF